MKKNTLEVEKADNKEWSEVEGELTVDVYQTEKEIVVISAVAGVKHENLDISVIDDVLIIKGSRISPPKEKGADYFTQECYWGNFSKRIIITDEIDPSKIDALMKEGILTIKIPRIIRKTKESIKVKNSDASK